MEWRACYSSSSPVDKRRETPLLILIEYFFAEITTALVLGREFNPEVIVCRRTANPIKEVRLKMQWADPLTRRTKTRIKRKTVDQTR